MQINVPTFPTGDGSTIKAVVGYPNYVFYATYDQGSIKITTERQTSWVDAFVNFWNTYWIPIILIVAGFAVISFIFRIIYDAPIWAGFAMPYLLIRALLPRPKLFEYFRYKSTSEILSDMLYVRFMLSNYTLMGDPSLSYDGGRIVDRVIHDTLYALPRRWDSTGSLSKLQLFNNDIEDYIEIDNFKIDARNRTEVNDAADRLPCQFILHSQHLITNLLILFL